MVLDDAQRDAFFGEIYRLSTEPFLTPAMTVAEVRSFLELAKPAPGARVLDLGAGWGRHLPALREAGLEPIGLDRSVDYMKRSLRDTGVASLSADVRRLPFRTASVPFVACFYSSIFFFEDNENLAALGEVARVLSPGGALVLQTANPIHLRRLGSDERSFSLAGGLRVTESSEFHLRAGREVGKRRVTLPSGEVLEGEFSIRHYAPGELEVLARRAGLKVERVCGDLALGPYRRDSRELVVLLRR